MRAVISRALILSAVLVGAPVLAAQPDGFITTRAKLSLLTTGNVRGSAVHVDTNDGILVLYGKVPTAAQRIAAERAVAGIDGVREVKNLLQVVADSQAKQVEASDKVIKDNVDKMLREDPALRDSKISSKSVDKGIVLLTGKAATLSDHYRAVVRTDAIPGVRRVATEVIAPEVFTPDERPIFLTEARAEARALGQDLKMKKNQLTSKAEKQGAAVKSSLDDMRISSEVKLRLWTTANVPSTQISVDTDNNVVTLFGIVPSAGSSRLAEAEAAKVDGVARIDNQLQVVLPVNNDLIEAMDKDLQHNLELAFKARPELRGVATEVKNGAIRLTGTVDSSWDRLNAVRIARMTPGARSVAEQLIVKDDAGKPKSQL